MDTFRRRNGFTGEREVNVPVTVLSKYLKHQPVLNALYITNIGFYPKASFHYHERKGGCHDNILFYCLGGKGYYDTHDGSFELNANQFAILPAHHFHRYQADINDPWTIYWLHFSGDKLAELNKLVDIDRYISPTPIKYDERFITAWEEMYNAMKGGYSIPNISYANLCLYRFISLFIFQEVDLKNYKEQDTITDSIQFLKANIHTMLSINNMADHFHYSPSHFSALFKNKTGQSPMEYFIEMKIHYACQLLDQTSLRVKEIAAKVGYDDPYYFSRLFSKIMEVSPNKYRQKS